MSGIDLQLRLHVHPLIGVVFEARLPAGPAAERVLDAIRKGGCGVSIGFRGSKHWHVERQQVGRLRVVDDCQIDHIALFDARAARGPAYPATWAFAVRSTAPRCPDSLRREADAHAWQELKRQFSGAK